MLTVLRFNDVQSWLNRNQSSQRPPPDSQTAHAPLGMTATRLGGRQARRTVFSLLVWLTQMTAWQSARLNFSTWPSTRLTKAQVKFVERRCQYCEITMVTLRACAIPVASCDYIAERSWRTLFIRMLATSANPNREWSVNTTCHHTHTAGERQRFRRRSL